MSIFSYHQQQSTHNWGYEKDLPTTGDALREDRTTGRDDGLREDRTTGRGDALREGPYDW